MQTCSILVWCVSSNHKLKLRQMGMSLVLWVFGQKPRYWTNQNFDATRRKVTGSLHFSTVHPEDMDICTKFHGNPSKGCLDILLKIINVNLLAALQERSEDHQGVRKQYLGTTNVCIRFCNNPSGFWVIPLDEWKLWPDGAATGKVIRVYALGTRNILYQMSW